MEEEEEESRGNSKTTFCYCACSSLVIYIAFPLVVLDVEIALLQVITFRVGPLLSFTGVWG